MFKFVSVLTLFQITLQFVENDDQIALQVDSQKDYIETVMSNIPEQIKNKFNVLKNQYERQYASTEEELQRLQIFFDNAKKIEQINSDPSHTFTAAPNQYFDITHQEFKHLLLMQEPSGTNKDTSKTSNINLDDYEVETSEDETETGDSFIQTGKKKIPGQVDWRKKGAVGPVQNQKKCGSCWSFSAAGAIEGHLKVEKKVNKLVEISQQYFIDCCGENDYCYGCDGAWPADAFEYAINNGAAAAKDYPEYNQKVNNCRQDKVEYSINDYEYVQKNTKALKHAVSQKPISVVIDASGWQFYKSGVFNKCPQSNPELNHAVLLIGYTRKYWIVKNSWSEKWGEDGYIFLKFNDDCGILEEAVILLE